MSKRCFRVKKFISISKITFKRFFMLEFRSHIFLCDRQNVKLGLFDKFNLLPPVAFLRLYYVFSNCI